MGIILSLRKQNQLHSKEDDLLALLKKDYSFRGVNEFFFPQNYLVEVFFIMNNHIKQDDRINFQRSKIDIYINLPIRPISN